MAAATELDAVERRVTELYTKAADQLGSDKAPVRLAGLYALERLAQNNPSQRQTIVNVLCAYLRMPYQPPTDPPTGDAHETDHAAHRERVQERQVRLTAQRLLTDHLHFGNDPEGVHPADTFWTDIDLNLTDAYLINFALSNCRIRTATFNSATFTGNAYFFSATFAGDADFGSATFAGDAHFGHATFTCDANNVGDANFAGATFTGDANFESATFIYDANFAGATFTGEANFGSATFTGYANFAEATFTRDTYFAMVTWTSHARFERATFTRSTNFGLATFSGGADFASAIFARDVPPEVARFLPPAKPNTPGTG